MPELTGKVALITGGSRGIGAAIATRLAADGADVAITYQRNADGAAKVLGEVRALGRRATAIAADSADPDAVRGAVETTVGELGRLDVLVNNAGIFAHGPFDEVSVEEFDRTFAIHVRAPFVAAQAAAAHLPDHDGRIITIGSDLAERTPFPGIALYAGSKSALVGLTKGLARDLGPRGITVNLVHPGSTDTDMNPVDGPTADAQRGFTALGHYGAGSDIAAMVAHLAGPDGRYVTGATILVDGGFTA
jgi:NAD(P)-dependent dehydrogenase (short-subunit alcohol dehydrogenase family)